MGIGSPSHGPAARDSVPPGRIAWIAWRALAIAWNAPNTLVGLAYGAAGLPLGARMRRGRRGIEIVDHPFMLTAIALGHVAIYSRRCGPARPTGRRRETVGRGGCWTVRDHEIQHIRQGEVLGPLYLPLHALAMLWSLLRGGGTHGRNWLETGPMSDPPRPWPWGGELK